MKNFVLIPDSYKGVMSSSEICEIMAGAIKAAIPGAGVRQIPVADGGEGSVDAFLRAVGGDKVSARVMGPYMKEMDAHYAMIDGGETAVIEMAACAGLPLAGSRPDPTKTTTYGAGQLILDAARNGAKRIVVGLGGSATNDGGCGAAAAVGINFRDESGKPFVPTGGTLSEITRIDASGYDKALRGVAITAMCDIDNPLYGPEGAAYVFAPQKGASADVVRLLDAGLQNLAAVIKSSLGTDIARLPGAGAAGGMGAGMSAFFGAELKMGIEVVLDAVHFDDVISGADMILTGEGRIDGQSLRGKVVIGVARRAKASGIPVVAIVGDIEDSASPAYAEGVAGIFSINRKAIPFAQAKLAVRENLAFTVENLMRFCEKITVK